jgi:hypothetical protein
MNAARKMSVVARATMHEEFGADIRRPSSTAPREACNATAENQPAGCSRDPQAPCVPMSGSASAHQAAGALAACLPFDLIPLRAGSAICTEARSNLHFAPFSWDCRFPQPAVATTLSQIACSGSTRGLWLVARGLWLVARGLRLDACLLVSHT